MPNWVQLLLQGLITGAVVGPVILWWLARRAALRDRKTDKVADDLVARDASVAQKAQRVAADLKASDATLAAAVVASQAQQTAFINQLMTRMASLESEARTSGASSEARGIRIARLEIEAVNVLERFQILQAENQEFKLQLASLGLQANLTAQAIEFASDAIVVSSQDGHILVWNRAGAILFGYSDLEIKGESITRLMPERYRARHTAGLERMSQGGNLRLLGRSLLMHGLHKNGKEFPISITLGGFESGTEQGLYFIAVIRPGTESSTAKT